MRELRKRIAWVGPYDVSSVAHRLDQGLSVPFHPATWIRNAARALAERPDVELHIVTFDKSFERDYRFIEDGLHFHLLRAPLRWMPRPLALYQLDRGRFQRELQSIRPDLVHGHGTENIFSYVAVTSGFPHVISIQAIIAHLFAQYRRISRRALEHAVVRFIEAYTVKHARHVIVKAPFAEPFVRGLNPAAPIHLLENIVHEVFFDVTRRPVSGRRRVLFIGTLINTKGAEELIRAFRAIAPVVDDVDLHLIGVGTQAYVQGVIAPMSGGLGGRVVMRGQLSSQALAGELADATMVVLPSYFETSPNVIAEAMVAGVPVIGTDVGGIPFMIRHGETGQIVPVRDVTALTVAIRRNLDDPEIAAREATRGQAEARRRFGRQRYVDALLDIYRTVLAR